MFVQNTPSLIRNPFASSLNSPHSMNEPKAYTTTPTYVEERPKKVNYFKLTEPDPDHKSPSTKVNLTDHTNLTNSTNSNLLISNRTTVAHQPTHPPTEPVHLPLSQPPIEKSKNHLLYKSYEKVKKSIPNEEASQVQFYKSLADHFQNQATNDCLSSPEVLSLQRLIIILCIFVIFSTLIQLFLDLIGTNNKYLNLLRGHAIFNIISVIICIMIIGISYLLSNLLTKEQIQKHMLNHQNRFYNYPNHHSSINYFNQEKDDGHIEVRLEISYYLIIFAGIFSLVASFLECNLFFNKPNLYLININNDQETSNLLNDESQAGYWSHLFNVNNPNLHNLINYYYTPPPAYTP